MRTRAIQTLLLHTALLALLSACSDQPQELPTEAGAATEQPLNSTQPLSSTIDTNWTPKSLSGDESHSGPNPHATLSVEQHISVAMRHADNGRVEEALDVLARAIIATPQDPSLFGALGGILLSQNRVTEALEYLSEAIRLAPNSAELRVNRSQAYRKLNRQQQAMEDLNKAVHLNPKLIAARFNRGSLLYNEARYELALADFDACILLEPSTAGPYFNRAVTREALGNLSGAISDMKRFIALSDNPEWNKIATETLEQWNGTLSSANPPTTTAPR